MARGWSQLRHTFVPKMAANQPLVLDAIRTGDFISPKFAPVTVAHPTIPDLTMTFEVMTAPLRIGKPGDSVYVTVSHRTEQALADLLGLSVLTPKLSDEVDRAADRRVEPQKWLKTEGAPDTIDAMVADSNALDAVIGAESPSKLISGGWKDWVNGRRLVTEKGRGLNYGGYTSSPATPQGKPGPKPSVTRRGRNVYQEPGGFHDVEHSDESQKFRGMKRIVQMSVGPPGHAIVSAQTIDNIALNPTLWPLASHEGPVLMRHPWLERCFSLDEGGGCNIPPGGGDPGGRMPGGGVPPAVPGGGGGAPPTQSKRLASSLVVVVIAGASVYALLRWL